MNRTVLYNLRTYQRYFFVFATMVLVLLSSCPIKSVIKNLAGIPTNKEQGLTKKSNPFFGNGAEKCISETLDTTISQTGSFNTNDWLPALLTTAFVFLPGYTLCNELPQFYGSLKIPGTLPIFLQYRKLII
ncbi:hypothetical protein SIO70_32435 [Chitinophaga sancti]|uniref:hypothetical protein n=1 Tax=Chitinophaga sancti TaxID=1004 RepID=UPI002A754C06|nr:hypothetical protein [Chitinophaga sancti]WPQ63077.1 hypothetical protein SIO70_32435 [Chitinophaga sancti]